VKAANGVGKLTDPPPMLQSHKLILLAGSNRRLLLPIPVVFVVLRLTRFRGYCLS
jgi:hypothetical protein